MKNPKFEIRNSKSGIDIDHVAKLANLNLAKEEKKIFEKQLSQILDYITQIESVDTKNVQPTFNVSTNKNITRSDIVSQSLSQKETLQNAKATKNGQFVTKGVFANE